MKLLLSIGGDWKKARKQKQSPLHILEPVDVNVDFSRAMVVKDSRMPKSVFIYTGKKIGI